MPIYDSSFLTKRLQNKTIARDFFNRQNIQNITSYGPLQGNFDSSILNSVSEGRQKNITKCQIGYEVDSGGGCPCQISTNIITPQLINNSGNTLWINSLFKYVSNPNTFNGQTEIIDIVTDSSNNIYAVGYYISPEEVFVLNTSGLTQATSLYKLPQTPTDLAYGFIIKYNTNGIVQWATYIPATLPSPIPDPPPNPPYSTTINSISIDTSNNIYVLGSYISNGTVTLQDASGFVQSPSSTTLPANSITTPNTFLAKYSSNGQVIWAKYFTSDDVTPKCVQVDNSNNIYITGSYISSTLVNLDGTVSLPASSQGGAYLIKYDLSGNILWATYIQGTNSTIGFNISVDSSNNIFVVGSYRSTTSFNLYRANGLSSPSQVSTSYTLQASATQFNNASFLIKYDLDGYIKWATFVANTQGGAVADNQAFANICDPAGNVYILGKYVFTSIPALNIYQANIFSQSVSNFTLPSIIGSGTVYDCYVIKYSNNGSVIWATTIQTNIGGDEGGGVTIDTYGNIYVTGQYESSQTVTLSNANGFSQSASPVTLPSSGGAFDNVFVIKYSTTGQILWGTYLTSNNREEFGATITVDSLNNLLVGGRTTLAGPSQLIYAQNANGNTLGPFQVQSQYYINDNINVDVGTGFLIKYI